MSRWLLLVLAAVLPSLVLAAGEASCPASVRVGFNDTDSPPMLMGRGERFQDPPGWQVVAVRTALDRLGCLRAAELVRLPARRLGILLAQGDMDFALLLGVTPERLQTLRFPLDARGQPDAAWAPVFGQLVLYARAGTPPPASWDGKTLPTGWRVGAIGGTVQEAVARERQWPVEAITAADFGLQMLNARRFDLLLASREALSPEVRAGVVEWGVAARMPFFAPASASFAQRHPAWTRAFWNEFCLAMRQLQPDLRPVACGSVPPGISR